MHKGIQILVTRVVIDEPWACPVLALRSLSLYDDRAVLIRFRIVWAWLSSLWLILAWEDLLRETCRCFKFSYLRLFLFNFVKGRTCCYNCIQSFALCRILTDCPQLMTLSRFLPFQRTCSLSLSNRNFFFTVLFRNFIAPTELTVWLLFSQSGLVFFGRGKFHRLHIQTKCGVKLRCHLNSRVSKDEG